MGAVQGVEVAGTGFYVPAQVVTNEDYEERYGVSADWILQVSGIKAAGLDTGHLEDPVGGNAVPLLIVFVGHDLRRDVESGPGNLDPLHCPHPLPSPLWPRSPQTFLTLLPDIS